MSIITESPTFFERCFHVYTDIQEARNGYWEWINNEYIEPYTPLRYLSQHIQQFANHHPTFCAVLCAAGNFTLTPASYTIGFAVGGIATLQGTIINLPHLQEYTLVQEEERAWVSSSLLLAALVIESQVAGFFAGFIAANAAIQFQTQIGSDN